MCVWDVQNAQDHRATRKQTGDLPTQRPCKTCAPSAHHGTLWHALSHAHASSPAHPNRLASPHCTQARIPHRCNPQHTHAQDPTMSQHAQMCASNDKATWQHKVERTAAATAAGDMRARRAQIWPVWAVRGSLRAAVRLERHQDLHGLSNARQLLLVVLDLRSTAVRRSRT